MPFRWDTNDTTDLLLMCDNSVIFAKPRKHPNTQKSRLAATWKALPTSRRPWAAP